MCDELARPVPVWSRPPPSLCPLALLPQWPSGPGPAHITSISPASTSVNTSDNIVNIRDVLTSSVYRVIIGKVTIVHHREAGGRLVTISLLDFKKHHGNEVWPLMQHFLKFNYFHNFACDASIVRRRAQVIVGSGPSCYQARPLCCWTRGCLIFKLLRALAEFGSISLCATVINWLDFSQKVSTNIQWDKLT